jgi:hypothetical protein
LLKDFDACLGGLLAARNNYSCKRVRLHGGLSGKWAEEKKNYEGNE